jgi:diaminopimelate epimerase
VAIRWNATEVTRHNGSLSKIPFWKVESIGNDFVLVHLDDVERLRGEQNADEFLTQLAIKTSDRRFGIGSDGLLAIGMDGDILVDRMFNPDGTEDFCGNGLRCVALHAHELGWVSNDFRIRHLDRLVPTHIRSKNISTEIGKASYDPKGIPVNFVRSPEKTYGRYPIWQSPGISIGGSALTTGSTHVVIPALPSEELFQLASPEIENDPQFPHRTSVIWFEEIAPMKLRIRIWERGAGETLGCGTGSSAAAVEYMRSRDLGGTVEVVNPGGSVFVTADSWDSPLTVQGDAVGVFCGKFPV